MENNNLSEIIPPIECLEMGCVAKSEKCDGCRYCFEPWFIFKPPATKKKNRED